MPVINSSVLLGETHPTVLISVDGKTLFVSEKLGNRLLAKNIESVIRSTG